MPKAHDITQNLENLGFDTEEVEVYLALLNEPILAVLDISRKTNIARTTVYRTVKSLKEKGAIEEIIDEHGKKYKAVHPKNFAQILENKRTELELIESSLKSLRSVKLPKSDVPRTQIRYYQGRKGMKQLLWNTLDATTDIYGQSLYEWVNLVGEKFLDKYNREFTNRKLNDYALIIESTVPRVVKKFDMPIHHQPSYDWIRVLPDNTLYQSGDTIIYNNIFVTLFWKHGEIIGVEMENKELAKMQLSLFKIAWETAVPLKEWLERKR